MVRSEDIILIGRTHHYLLSDTVVNIEGQSGRLQPLLQVGDDQGGVELPSILFVLNKVGGFS